MSRPLIEKNTDLRLTLCLAVSLCISVCAPAARAYRTIEENTKEIEKDLKEVQVAQRQAAVAQDYNMKKCYNNSVAIYKSSAAMNYSFRAGNYAEAKNFSLALSDIKNAIRLAPETASYKESMADIYVKAGDITNALSELGKAIGNSTGESRTSLLLKRAEIYKLNDENEKAIQDYSQLTYSKNLEAFDERAKLYLKLGRREEAIADYQSYIENSKLGAYGRDSAYRSIADIYEEAGQEEEELKTLNTLVREKPDAIWRRISFYERNQRLADALDDRNEEIRQLRKALNEADANSKKSCKQELITSLQRRAKLYKRMGKLDLAAADYCETIQIAPNYDNYRERCNFYLATEKWADALADLNQMVALEPLKGLSKRADFYSCRKKDQLALDDYNQAVKRAQSQFEAADQTKKYDAIKAYITAIRDRQLHFKTKNETTAALADLSEIIRLDQKALEYASKEQSTDKTCQLSEHLDERAEVLERLHKEEESSADLEEAVRIMQKLVGQLASEPDKELADSWTTSCLQTALSARANYKLKQKNFDGGLADINALLAVDNTRLSARADYYKKAGKLELAEADLKADIETKKQIYANPPKAKGMFDHPKDNAKSSYSSSLWALSSFYEETGKLDKAIDVLNDLLAIKPGEMQTNYQKAKLFLKLNQPERAAAAFEEVAAIKTTSEWDYTRIGEALLYLKRYDKAVAALSKYISYRDEVSNTDERLMRAKAYKALSETKKAQEDLNFVISKINTSTKLSDSEKLVLASAQAELKSMGMKVPATPNRPQANSQIAKNEAKQPPTSSNNQPIRDKWALVVGISKFQNPSYNLKYAAKDAQDFYNYLVNEAGFKRDHVCLLLNEKATRENIMTAFGTKFLPSVSEPGDLVVIFISTHGTPANKDSAGSNFVVAYNTDASNLYPTGVNMDDLYGRIKDGVNTDRALIVMDTCFSGAGVPGAKSLNDGANFDINQIVQGCGRLVITSSSNDERSYESTNANNGVFTKYFLQSLRQSGGKIDVRKAFETTKEKVEWEVKSAFNKSQTPQLGGEWEGKELVLSAPATKPRTVFKVPFAQSAAAPVPVATRTNQAKGNQTKTSAANTKQTPSVKRPKSISAAEKPDKPLGKRVQE